MIKILSKKYKTISKNFVKKKFSLINLEKWKKLFLIQLFLLKS